MTEETQKQSIIEAFARIAEVQSDGSPDLVTLIVGIFDEDMSVRIRALRDAQARGSIDDFRRETHTIKGVAANLGADALVRKALELEESAKSGRLPAGSAEIDALEAEFKRAKALMAELLKSRGKS